MLPADDPQVPERAANPGVDEDLLSKARELDINLSTTPDQVPVETCRKKQREQWLAENRDAMKAYNEHVDRRGVFSER